MFNFLSIKASSLGFRPATDDEKNHWILFVLNKLFSKQLTKVGEHRKEIWESGWKENLKEDNVVPKYFNKYPVVRWNQEFVIPNSKNFERQMLYAIQEFLLKKYAADSNQIYEFGCGTGHNLKQIKKIFPKKKLIGLDWTKSSQQILRKFGLEAYNFDFFNPNYDINLKPESAVLTVAALEQTGKNFKKFINYLISKDPDICIHIEPIEELLDKSNLLDYLSISYFHKRKYLSGLLKYLKKLEDCGVVKIHMAERSYVGSLFIEGYSVIVWSPVRTKSL